MAKRHITGWKATILVSMSNYIDSGSIIAIATSLAFWKSAYFPGDDGGVTRKSWTRPAYAALSSVEASNSLCSWLTGVR